MLKHNILNIEKVFQGEQGRGIITSVCSGGIANLLVYLGTKVFGMSIETSAAVFGLIVGNIIGYIADIMFAKQNFDIKGKLVQLPLTAFGQKFKWLLKSLLSKSFFRFWIIVFIDMIMTLTVVGYLTKYFDDNQLFLYGWRDSAIVFGFAVASFLVYVNPLRFTWAYNSQEDPTMNMLILMWFTMALLIYVSMKRQSQEFKKVLKGDKKEEEKDESSDLVSGQFLIKQIQKAEAPQVLEHETEAPAAPIPTESYSKTLGSGMPAAPLEEVTEPPKNIHNQEVQLSGSFDDKYHFVNEKIGSF